MKRKKIVAGNWKMNMTHDESVNLIEELKQISTNDVDIKIAPSFTNLNKAVSLLGSSEIEVICLLYTSPSPRDPKTSRMPSSA